MISIIAAVCILIVMFTGCPEPGDPSSEAPGEMPFNLISKDSLAHIQDGSTVSEPVILGYSMPSNMDSGTFYYSLDSRAFQSLAPTGSVEISESGPHHIDIYFMNAYGEKGDSPNSCDFTIEYSAVNPLLPRFDLTDGESDDQLGIVTNASQILLTPTYPDDASELLSFQYRLDDSDPWMTIYSPTVIKNTIEDETSTLTVQVRYLEKSAFGESAVNTRTLGIDRKAPSALTFNEPESQRFRNAKVLWSHDNSDVLSIDVSYRRSDESGFSSLRAIGDGSSPVSGSGSDEVGAVDDVIFSYTLTDAAGNETSCETTISPGATTDSSTILYVSEDGTGYGGSWDTAFGDLQTAIDDAASHMIRNIYVKEGTYYPTTWPNGLDAYGENGKHFALKNHVTVTGGFAGNEDPGEEPSGGETILSGNDTSYHVIYIPSSAALTDAAVLKNVSITGGKAIAQGDGAEFRGGGIYLNEADPVLEDVRLYGNYASSGSALYMDSSSPSISGILCYENTTGSTGAIEMRPSGSDELPRMTRSKVFGNTGRGIYLSGGGTFELENVAVYGNTGSGIYTSTSSMASLTHCTIAFNGEDGLEYEGVFKDRYPVCRNSIIWGNTDREIPYYANSSVSFTNVTSSIIEGIDIDGSGCIFVPTGTRLFRYTSDDPVVDDMVALYEDAENPALDSGTDDESPLYDIDGNPRTVYLKLAEINDLRSENHPLIDSNSGSTGHYIDIGAYEVQKPDEMPTALFVDNHASPEDFRLFGTSSENPSGDLQKALYLAKIHGVGEVHVAKGKYVPEDDPGNLWGDAERSKHFALVNDVHLIGGYESAFSETLDETILSGNIGDEDSSTDNCYHVIYLPTGTNQIQNTAILERCTIAEGRADWTGATQDNVVGAGMYTVAGYPTIVDCLFRDNYAAANGGAIFTCMGSGASGTLPIWQSLFLNNTAGDHGGAVYISDDIELQLNQTVFMDNVIEDSNAGTAIYLEAASALSCYQSSFIKNTTLLPPSYADVTTLYIEHGGEVPSRFYNTMVYGQIFDYEPEEDPVTGEPIRESEYHATGVLFPHFTDGCIMLNGIPLYSLFNIVSEGEVLEIEEVEDLHFRFTDPPPQNPHLLWHVGDSDYLLADGADLDHDGDYSEDIPYDILWNPRMTDGKLSVGAIQSEREYLDD